MLSINMHQSRWSNVQILFKHSQSIISNFRIYAFFHFRYFVTVYLQTKLFFTPHELYFKSSKYLSFKIIIEINMVSQDQQTFIYGLLLSIPFSYCLKNIQGSNSRLCFSIASGIFLQYYVYGLTLLLPLLLNSIAYGLILYKGRKCGFFITAISIGFLSFYHIYLLIFYYGSWRLDVSIIIMASVCKYSLFAYAYQDGRQRINQKPLTEEQQKYKLLKLPSFIQFIGYCTFTPTCIINTAIQYKTYSLYMEEKCKLPTLTQSLIQCAKQLKIVVICAVIYIIGTFLFPLSKAQNKNFTESSALYVFVFMVLCVTFLKYKYYIGWKISLLAVHISGISYSQDNKFDVVKICDPFIVETTIYPKQKIAHWNMSVQLWLRRCIYERLNQSKAISQLITFMISSFWHGFYGGYYFSFIFWFLQTHIAAGFYKISKDPTHWLQNVYKKGGNASPYIVFAISAIVWHADGIYFQVLSTKNCWKILTKLNFLPVILLIAALLIVQFSPSKNKKQNDKST